MNGWPLVDLEEVSDISAGNPAPQDADHFCADGHPFVRMQDVGRKHIHPALVETTDRVSLLAVRECGLRLYPAGTLLIPKSGASVNLNHRAMLGQDAYVVSHLATIIPDQRKILPSYLFHWSQRYDPRSQAQVTSLPSLPLSLIKAAKVPLPPLEEQRRIVGLLDRAAEIRHRTEAARAKARAIIPAIFLDTFGDPATNPKGWAVKTLGNLGELDRGRSRHRPRNAPELYGGPYPFIQTGDVANSNGRIRRHEQSYSEAGLAQSKMWPSGTLCITIAANIGKTGILEFDACFPDSVVGFKPWSEVTSEFIQASLDFMQAEIEARAPQAAQKNINLQVLRGLEMICPPLGLQIAFAEQVHRLESLAHQLDAAAAKAQAMAAGLSAEVFGEGPIKGNGHADGAAIPGESVA